MITWFKKQTKGAKIILVGAAAFWLIVFAIAGASGSKEKEVAHVDAQSSDTVSKKTTPTAEVKKVEPEPAPIPPPPPPVDPAVEAANYRAGCKNIEFRALNKNPDSYAGQKFSVRGQVIQILESNNETEIRLNVTPPEYGSYWSDTIYIAYAGKTDALESSIINVYGDVVGTYS